MTENEEQNMNILKTDITTNPTCGTIDRLKRKSVGETTLTF